LNLGTVRLALVLRFRASPGSNRGSRFHLGNTPNRQGWKFGYRCRQICLPAAAGTGNGSCRQWRSGGGICRTAVGTCRHRCLLSSLRDGRAGAVEPTCLAPAGVRRAGACAIAAQMQSTHLRSQCASWRSWASSAGACDRTRQIVHKKRGKNGAYNYNYFINVKYKLELRKEPSLPTVCRPFSSSKLACLMQ